MTSDISEDPFLPPLRLLTQGFKARPQLYARALFCLVRRPANSCRPFDFRSEQAVRTSRTSFAPLFLPQHSLKNAFRRHFCRIFSSQSPLAHIPVCTRRRIMRTQDRPQKARRAAILRNIFVDLRSGPRPRIMRVRIKCSRSDGGKGFLSFFRILSRAYTRARSRSYA